MKARRRVMRGDPPLDGAIKGTDYPGLDLFPADFTYRHLDLLLDEASVPPGSCAGCSGNSPAITTR